MPGVWRRVGRASTRRTLIAWGVALTVVAGVLAAPPAAAEPVVIGQPAASAIAGGGAASSGIVKAADLSKFQAGNIISDAVFFNKDSMSEAQIQAFLEARVPRCEPGYTCLKDWYDTSRTTNADAMCGAYSGGVRERASRIIYKVAQACGINPQVILVTLQKEQGLVNHVWPSDWRYTIAMGQGCPDTAACDTRYYGFFNQVYGAAWQLKRYANPPGTSQYFTWYAPGKTWNVLYNPNRGCGSSPVYIQNQATANLYYYTPYQPNAAALRAGYGEASDACSSYGNRNFYNYFTDWFGSTMGGCPAPDASSIVADPALMVVNSASVNVRTGPGQGCTDGVRQIDQGVLVPRSATFGEWSRVVVDGVTGWVHRDYLTPLSQTPLPVLAVDEPRHVVALDGAGNIWAYPFSPSGRWGDPVRLFTGQALTQIVAAGDLTGDGHRDFLGVDAQKRVWLYRGDGSGYSAPVAVPVDWTRAAKIASAGDFDGDGWADVFTVDAGGALQLWRGDGRGSFRAGVGIGVGWGGMDALVGGVDLNGDGRSDLLARTPAGALYLYTGDGRGAWTGSRQIGVGWGGMDAMFATGDFTGDGRTDVFARDAGGGLNLYNGTANGLAYVAQVGVGWGGMTSLAGPGIALPPVSQRNLVPGVGDLTGDGAPDVAAVAGTSLLLYHGDGRGGWSGSSSLGNWPAGARLVTLGDFNRDGLRDLGRVNADGTFWLLPGTAAGGVGDPVAIGNGWAGFTAIVGALDFDGDGYADVIARTGDGLLRLYRGNGAGGWLDGAGTIGNGWGEFNALVNIGDFDGDGASDLIARSASTGALWLYSTDGRGGWSRVRQIGTGWWSFDAFAGPGDFDGDGDTDVLGRTGSGALLLYRGDGRGGWSTSGQIGQGWSGISQLG